MIGAVGLILSLVLLSFIISSISKPILLLSNEMDRFANGNLNIDLDIKNGDEVGRLGKSLQKAVNIIRSLHHEIDIMIAEQAKGNTDYVLNTEEFHGEYQLLARHILELSSLGMRDSLTGMPNRRSFDNRLKTEWNRAKREETPISILMIDIDKFKDYNDAYGHLQGDKALQTIAKAFAQSIKRTVDFAARWGGEEFIVLLPNTNLNGALIVAEQIRTKIENMVIPCDEEKFGKEAEKITVSIGVETQIPAQVSGPVNLVDSLILNADKALYQAKETGRNRVCRYGEGLSRR